MNLSAKAGRQPDKMSGQQKTSYRKTRLFTYQSLATLNLGHALICDLNRSSSYTQQPSTSLFLHSCVNTSVDILHTQTHVEHQIQEPREHAHTHHFGRHGCTNFQVCNSADRDPSFSVDSLDDAHRTHFLQCPCNCHPNILRLPSICQHYFFCQ